MINNKKIVAIIPARGGSKGVPKKNIKLLNNKPLIAYTIEEALKSKYIDRVIVSTDDLEIKHIAKKFGAEVPYLRPAELATDDSPTIDTVMHMVKFLKYTEKYHSEYICLLQCTSPLRTFEDIDRTIKKMIDTGMDGAVSVCKVEVNPYWTNVFNGDRLEYFLEEGKNITRRQDLPKIYRINGAVYVIKIESLIEMNTLEPENIAGCVMSDERSVDIDNNLDFNIAEIFMKESEDNA
ncbi:MAG: acylneuraminate cytidylyltransferase family protein [Marinisporobacter sp.]|nr:acylneuraminate cytidylyltransferase family protein [Marinisporobacter sp.]